jgi:hypothetical protein
MSPPAGWYPDPERGHQFRYYDGSLWTAQVADNGTVMYAPVNAPGMPHLDAYPQHAVLGGLRPGGWLPEVPRFKMWVLAVLSAFIFWINVDGHRLALPLGVAFAAWCWWTTAEPLEKHAKADSGAVSEMRAARYLALACCAFCMIQFVIWAR